MENMTATTRIVTVPDLAQGFTARAMTMEDVPAITAMLNAGSQHLVGKDLFTEHSVSSDWEWGGADPALNSRVVLAADSSLVAYEGFWAEDASLGQLYIWGRVHPAHTGRGLGTHLLRWAEERAGHYLHQAPVDSQMKLVSGIMAIDQPGNSLHLAEGYQAVRYFFRMLIDMDGPQPEPDWLTGIQVRSYRVGDDDLPTMLAVREAFADHWGHIERSLEVDMEAWRTYRLGDPVFDPSLYFLAMDGDEIAGFSLCKRQDGTDALCGHVSTLGVRRPWRKRGLGRALLLHSFKELQRRGCRQVSLHVDADSLTGAVRLYESAGMHSDEPRQMTRYEKVLLK